MGKNETIKYKYVRCLRYSADGTFNVEEGEEEMAKGSTVSLIIEHDFQERGYYLHTTMNCNTLYYNDSVDDPVRKFYMIVRSNYLDQIDNIKGEMTLLEAQIESYIAERDADKLTEVDLDMKNFIVSNLSQFKWEGKEDTATAKVPMDNEGWVSPEHLAAIGAATLKLVGDMELSYNSNEGILHLGYID